MEFENKEQIAVFIERHLKELGGEAYGVPYIANAIWDWHEQQAKSVDLADVVDSESELCRCHDPMTQTNILTGKAECYFCGGRR